MANRNERRREVRAARVDVEKMRRQARRIRDRSARLEALTVVGELEQLEGEDLVAELQEVRSVPAPRIRYRLSSLLEGIRRRFSRS